MRRSRGRRRSLASRSGRRCAKPSASGRGARSMRPRSATAFRYRGWPKRSASRWHPERELVRSRSSCSSRCARMTCSSRPSSTIFRPRSHPSPSSVTTTPIPWSASSCTWAGWRWRTPSASSTTRSSSGAASKLSSARGPVATTRRTRWMRTTSARSSTACRRRPVRAWASTGW